MDKEALDRIRKAYSCGLKVQIWFNGYWEDFDVRDYSMYSDPFSENRQYRIIGSDYADIAEKQIAELKAVERMALYSKMSDRLARAEELLLELYDCIPSSMADSCKETLQKVALFFKDSEVEK